MFEVENVSSRVGSLVRTTKQDMLSGKYADDISQLLVERSALAFKEMNFTPEEQQEFAATIGDIWTVGGEDQQKISMDPTVSKSAAYSRGAFFWHIDGAMDDIPAKATMLTAKVLAEPGQGDTLVANTFAAYDDLPDEDKEKLAGLKVRHTLESSQRMVNPEPSYEELKRWHGLPPKTHPLVWAHRSGEKSLLIGASAYYVEGMGIEEGRELLTKLLSHSTQPQYVYRHRWTVGDFLLWDNTGTLHKADAYPLDSKRLMLRTTLHGEESIAA